VDKKMKAGVQLFSYRKADMSLAEQVQSAAESGFDGVEFAWLDETDVAAVTDVLDERSVSVAGAHEGMNSLEQPVEDVLKRHEAVGCDRIIVPHIDEHRFCSQTAIDAVSRDLAEIAETVETYDMRLGYHNHDHEFKTDGLAAHETAFHYFLETVDETLEIELDIGWTAAAGYDPVELIETYGDRMHAIHVKDIEPRHNTDTFPTVNLGEGIIAVEDCIQAAHDHGVEWAIYENETLSAYEQTLRQEHEQLRDYL
jgi:sugar phosphate isomerase/epimerase